MEIGVLESFDESPELAAVEVHASLVEPEAGDFEVGNVEKEAGSGCDTSYCGIQVE